MLVVVALLQGCVAAHRYDFTKNQIASSSYFWTHHGGGGDVDPTPAEVQRIKGDLDQCVLDLNKEARSDGYWPSREERVADLVDCMKSRGWELVHSDVVVTG